MYIRITKFGITHLPYSVVEYSIVDTDQNIAFGHWKITKICSRIYYNMHVAHNKIKILGYQKVIQVLFYLRHSIGTFTFFLGLHVHICQPDTETKTKYLVLPRHTHLTHASPSIPQIPTCLAPHQIHTLHESPSQPPPPPMPPPHFKQVIQKHPHTFKLPPILLIIMWIDTTIIQAYVAVAEVKEDALRSGF